MPPKKEAKKGKEVAPPPPADPQVDLKALQTVTELLSKAKHLRNYFQLERDKIHKFWEISKKELENARFELMNADSELESMEQAHQVEMKVYKQKVRHLLYEHKLQVQDIGAHTDQEILQATSLHQRQLGELKEEKRKLHAMLEVALTGHEDRVSTMREEHKYLTTITKRQAYEAQLKEARKKYNEKIALLRDELELRRRAEIHEIEERKNEHINELVRKHEEAFAEMKTYYNQITSNNLELIKSLKEEIANMKRNDEHNGDLMYAIEKENYNLNEPLEIAKREVAELQQQLHNYEKDKLSLRNTRSRLRALDGEYRQLSDDHVKLQQKYVDVQTDRDNLTHKFEAALHDAQDVVGEKNTGLQQRLLEVNAKVESRDAQLASVLAAVNLEPATLEAVTRKLEDVIETKNRAIKDLHFELRKIEKQHKDVVSEYERRCHKAKLPSLQATDLFAGTAAA